MLNLIGQWRWNGTPDWSAPLTVDILQVGNRPGLPGSQRMNACPSTVRMQIAVGETLHALAKRHDISRNLGEETRDRRVRSRCPSGRSSSGIRGEDRGTRTHAGRQALEIEFLKGRSKRTTAEKRDYVRHHRPMASPLPRMPFLTGLPRSSYYDAPPVKADDADIVANITGLDSVQADGYRRVGAELRHQGMVVNSKKICRCMRDDYSPSAVGGSWPRPTATTTGVPFQCRLTFSTAPADRAPRTRLESALLKLGKYLRSLMTSSTSARIKPKRVCCSS